VTRFGMRLGDELLAFNGTRIRSANQLATLVGVLPAGAWVSLEFRPQLDAGGYGEPRTVHFPLHRLDTGSSRDADRLAAPEHRAEALRALTRTVAAGAPAPGAVLHIEGPEGRSVRLSRLGERLRIDSDGVALVRLDADDGFALEDGAVRDLWAGERAKRGRVLTSDPWLWRGPQHRSLIEAGELLGGVMVHGRPAYRVGLPGDGYREVWFTLDGRPAGCSYRDPVQKAQVELRMLDGRTRIVLDGEMAHGWTVHEPVFDTPDSAAFERPAR